MYIYIYKSAEKHAREMWRLKSGNETVRVL